MVTTKSANEATNILGTTLREFVNNSPKTIEQIAADAGVERNYIWRLIAQEADWLERPLQGGKVMQPSRDVMICLAIALELNRHDTDELLLTAGYAPISHRRAA